MHINKTRALAGVALLSAFSLLLLLLGTFASVNTLFFTAMAAYLVGYSISKYGLSYGGMQLAVCVLLDIFLNPDKFHWFLYLCLGVYIFLSEVSFRKWNRIADLRKKMRVQLIFGWILFNIIYIPVLLFFRKLFFTGSLPGGLSGDSVLGCVVFWLAGQAGWFLYDKAYRVFFKILRERKL
ncbi:MAG: hypothetical protein NC293_09470 [Roseburia sp.]|nr:hypothetical protein [Roseburia sp.]